MNIFKQFIEQLFWWVPTKNDQKQNRLEEMDKIRKDLPDVVKRMIDFGNEGQEIRKKLEKTFSEQQYKLWLDMLSMSQKENFEANRMRCMQDRLKEIPDEILATTNKLEL